jgi:hypothetical protein
VDALDRIAWVLAEAELGAWRRAGHVARLWWRDDDAREPSPALDRLLALCNRFNAPVALAIIPDRDLAPLAGRLSREPLVCPIQHGCDHLDRAGAQGPSSEFPLESSPDEIAAAINAAWRRLSAAMNPAPIYAPPWNRAPANVAQALAATPLTRLSLYGEDRVGPQPGLNAHLDVMSWRPAQFRGVAPIMHRLRRLLRARRRAARWRAPIGVLTHHRNLDPPAWAFLTELLAWVARHNRELEWRSARELIGDDRVEVSPHPG